MNPGSSIRHMKNIDLDKIVFIHKSCFPESRSTKLGKQFLERLYSWYSINHPGLFFVAEDSCEVVGFVCGTIGSGGGQKRFRYTLPFIILSLIKNPILLLSKETFKSWKTLIKGMFKRKRTTTPAPTPTPNPIGIKGALDSIAVNSSARGHSIGFLLVEKFEEAAIDLGATYLSLGVEADNLPARKLYEKCGWHLVSEKLDENSANYRKDII